MIVYTFQQSLQLLRHELYLSLHSSCKHANFIWKIYPTYTNGYQNPICAVKDVKTHFIPFFRRMPWIFYCHKETLHLAILCSSNLVRTYLVDGRCWCNKPLGINDNSAILISTLLFLVLWLGRCSVTFVAEPSSLKFKPAATMIIFLLLSSWCSTSSTESI